MTMPYTPAATPARSLARLEDIDDDTAAALATHVRGGALEAIATAALVCGVAVLFASTEFPGAVRAAQVYAGLSAAMPVLALLRSHFGFRAACRRLGMNRALAAEVYTRLRAGFPLCPQKAVRSA